MNEQLLQWGLFSFMIGIILSLPLAAVHYRNNTGMRKLFVNPRKLKSAHLDYFTQAFAMGFAFLLESFFHLDFSIFIIVPLIFGTIMNPTILLLEATPFIKSGMTRTIYKFLKALSPTSLLIAWFVIAFQIMPIVLKIMFVGIVILVGLTFVIYHTKPSKKREPMVVNR